MALIEEIEPPSYKHTTEKIKDLRPKTDQPLAENIFTENKNQLVRSASRRIKLFTTKSFDIIRKLHAKVKASLNNLIKSVGNFILSNKYLPHYALVALGILVVISNVSEKIQTNAFYYAIVSTGPDEEYSIASSVDQYTPLIPNGSSVVQKAITASASPEGFVSTAGTVDTQITARVAPLPDNSSETVQYIVKNGDTLSTLGMKFDVKIATLKYLNDISDVDMLKPGLAIKVPQKGYEVSATAIAKKDKDNKAKLVATQRNTVARNSSLVGRSYASGTTRGAALIVPINHNGITRGLQRGHNGIDYRANVGTAVMSAADGVVRATSTGWSGGYGNEILVDHGERTLTRYAHLSSVNVSIGESVGRGEIIGKSGNSGRSTGPHLHFEKILNGVAINPF